MKTLEEFIKETEKEIFLSPIGMNLDNLMIECIFEKSTKSSRWNVRKRLESEIKKFVLTKLRKAGDVAMKETLDFIAHNEGWEESRDFYAKKLGVKLKYKEKTKYKCLAIDNITKNLRKKGVIE